MIFLLDIILGLNLLWAYKSFKSILSPPVLMGSGMFLASFVATLYYKVWEMDKICFDTVFYLGGSTVFFTLSCLLFLKKIKFTPLKGNKFEYDMSIFNLHRIKLFLIFIIVLGLLVCYFKIKEYGRYFGSYLNLQELLHSVRADAWSGDREFKLPLFIRISSRLFGIFAYISVWFLALCLLNYKNKTLIFLSFTVFFIFVFDGLLRGAKTGAFDRIAFFASIYFFMRCCKMRSLTLDFRIIRTIGYSFLLLIFVFESINVFIGRKERDNTHDKSSLFAIYCGAQIKNFDIYIKGNDGNYDTKYWGGETFKSFYNENDEKYFRPPGTFQKVGLNSLGNVYTNIYAYHKDFGGIGVWVLTFLSAFISMFIYNRVLNNLNKPYNRNIYLYIYSMFTIALFMSFFSPKFYEYTFTIGFLKRVILISICLYLFDRLTKISKHVVKI